MTDDREPIGGLLDSLGVTHTTEEGELVSDAVVVLRVVDNDGDERITITWSDGLSWVTRAGMLHHALHEETADSERGEA